MKKLLPLFMMFSMINLSAQESPLPKALYAGDIPFSKVPVEALDEFGFPRFYPFALPEDVSKDVVFLIIPGGGYGRVAFGHEGLDVAKRLNEQNYSAYVLFYRVPKKELMTNKKFVPLQDATTLLEMIRAEHPNKKIAVVGFSAGGHLAATLSNFPTNDVVITKNGVTPKVDYSILAYPVISMEDGVTHTGSKNNLIGADASLGETMTFSLDKQVSPKTPATFIVHAKDDKAVPIENTYRYMRGLETQQVPFESYIFEKGGHGFGLTNKEESGDWFGKMLEWLERKSVK